MTAEEDLISDMGGMGFYDFILYAFPWGEPGTELEHEKGPREWQAEYAKNIDAQVNAGKGKGVIVQEACSSGHGIGKGTEVSWVILWSMSTMEDTRGVVTANTDGQLKTKTWPELGKWYRMCITRHWFTFTATALYSVDPDHEKTWRFDAIPWSESNPEAFAGLHNQGKRVVVIKDEASSIPDKIWEVCEGALTDEKTEIFWLVFGNPTRSMGRFRECFGKRKHRWSKWQIDSRDVEGTNKDKLQKWVDDYGEDSDFVRVRVRGLFPNSSDMQFISSAIVHAAQKRPARSNRSDPLIMTLDVARGGDDYCVIRFRRGLDAKSFPVIKIPGSEARDSMKLSTVVCDMLEQHMPDAFFYDDTGVGGPVGDRVKQLGWKEKTHPVLFGGTSPDPHYANMRAYIYGKARDWLRDGGAIDDDPELETDLTSVEFTHNPRDQVILEKKEHMKERGLASPDNGDAFCMSFAFPVSQNSVAGVRNRGKIENQRMRSDYDIDSPV